ncbi:hypothetical protein BU24DRAFT_453667 [Aaosphaeria arxii CBS 175.79]|uniref:Uncharacterized protein n=1 Tax=Aaosphaeria arxii CBS 175.79 TaxID=1450172 RepID=A0A6A5XH21_9PLEO|nr:uncharacterized protein BU24DRAFT_453667 [Aaosphaeria arxii CBS 175.79]KAF2012233.1 hypothetical protein BU24DRAFT_453667 [Aaosphaeria arxii CBS 175.79]
MQFSTSKIITLAVLFSPAALAAQCDHNGSGGNIEDAWKVRETVCGGGCPFQQPCTRNVNAATLQRQRLDGGKGYSHCWDATEEIINQCLKGGWRSGTWSLDGQWYYLDNL